MINKYKITGGITGLLILLTLGAVAATQSVPATSTLSASGTFCLPAQNLLNLSSLNIFGGATDKNGSAISVKWTVWAGPTQFPPPIASVTADRLFKLDFQNVSQTVAKDTLNPTFVWTQACVFNGNTDHITFALQETPQ